MFRSVLIIVFVIVILWLARTIMQRLKQAPSTKKTFDSKDTVQCLYCKTYIPREDAVISDEKTFCSQQHLLDWNKSA